MVELEAWVAKEASDSGQVVDDSNLTDQAIFERLQQDVVFDRWRLDSYNDTAT